MSEARSGVSASLAWIVVGLTAWACAVVVTGAAQWVDYDVAGWWLGGLFGLAGSIMLGIGVIGLGVAAGMTRH